MEKCDICKRLYPKQVLTKVVYNKKKKNLEWNFFLILFKF
jgi:hypothetical protein